MELSELIGALARPKAFPNDPSSVEVRHTHISAVYLAEDLVYKIKKPVDFGFLNFLAPGDRKKYCEAEVRLNSRLAPGVYLGVVPVTMEEDGPAFEGKGPVIEWAVKMRRMPDEATLAHRLLSGGLSDNVFRMLGHRIAAFHETADKGPEIAVHGSYAVIAKNSGENFEQSRPQAGLTVDAGVLDRMARLNAEALVKLKPLMEARAAQGMTRDVHGDLHLDHVYYFPDLPPPGDVAVLDCVEFSDSYRCSDVIADMAFLAMDLIFHGRRDLAAVFSEAYFSTTGDDKGRALLDFYIAYRAAVRGKVEGMQALAVEIPPDKRAAMKRSSTAHWLICLGSLAPPAERPALLLTSGLPGSGKSRLAADLAENAGFKRIVSDVVRKELAGLKPTDSAKAAFGEGIYSPEWNERTYGECLHRASQELFRGGRVVVDASFREAEKRELFTGMAEAMGVPCIVMHRSAPEEIVRERLSRRGEKSVSDADWNISAEAAKRWEVPGAEESVRTFEIPHMEDKRGALALALGHLASAGLY